MWIHWKRPAEDYFDMLVSDAFDVIHQPVVRQSEDEWLVEPNGDNAAALTFLLVNKVSGGLILLLLTLRKELLWNCWYIEAHRLGELCYYKFSF